MENNTYDEIEEALIGYKMAELAPYKEEFLRQLLGYITPLIKKKIKHYFGYIDDDMLQCGYVKAIELIDRYDMDRGVLFMGYMKRMLGCYFFDEKRKQLRLGDSVEFDETYIEWAQDIGYAMVEIEDLLKCLSYKEKYLVENHIMDRQILKQTAVDLDISYVYAKELKRNALKKLRLMVSL